ncbi:uncharacterized protein LOC112092044 [Morus notabilis]|uniref:uncharacterized protein LOC112092044 n=1 Tax=Morus notabilis TaxID=981085 RepID=UPI000CED5038|nr:uncharacterized protein LOC112092044 [Morus notabilis]
MNLAQQVEDRLEAVDRIRRARAGRGIHSDYGGKSGYISYSNYFDSTESSLRSQTPRETFPGPKVRDPPTGPTHPTASGGPAFRRLSFEEIQQKRARGLCYWCDEKFSPRHRCKLRQLQVLLAAEDDFGREEGHLEEGEATLEEEEEVGEETAALSLNSIQGFTIAKTMKLQGTIGGREVAVLVDSGASHSFISNRLVHDLAIPTESSVRHNIQVGNGMSFQQIGICRGVRVLIQEQWVIEDFFPFELGSADIVLGVTWLKTLGEVRADWGKFTVKFQREGKWISWTEDPSLSCSPVSLRAMARLWSPGEMGVLLELCSVDAGTPDAVSLPMDANCERLIHEFSEVFDIPKGLPPRRAREHGINLQAGASPPNVRPYRYPHIQKAEIERQVSDMLISGIIRPSCCPYSSLVLLVKKKDGSWRFCVDYRALNQLTVPDKFPIPVIDKLLDELQGAKVFSKLDLTAGYHQVRVRERDVEKTAFRMHEGHYEFFVMSFGLTNAPATQSWEAHYDHLRQVLAVLKQEKLVANYKKCTFGREQVEYLGHVISTRGVSADPSKVEAMLTWPSPRNIRELRGFLGLTGYYRRFVQGYGSIARPLTELLKRGTFGWSYLADGAFLQLKKVMTELPVLAMPDFTKSFVFETNASSGGVGAVLIQDGRPIAYFNKALAATSRLARMSANFSP